MADVDVVNSKTKLLKSHLNEYVKTKVFYDVEGRPEFVYSASSDLEDGGPCTVTQYAYIGTTPRVDFMKESEAVWDATWETF